MRRDLVTTWEETPPLEYDRLYRGVPRYRWWRPLLALVIAGFYYLTLAVVFTVAVLVTAALISGDAFTEEAMFALVLPDTQQPLSILLTFGSVALMLPAVILAMLSVGLTPVGRVWSVALRIRWRWIGRTILPAIVCLLFSIALSIGLSILAQLFAGDVTEPSGEAVTVDYTLALISLAIALLVVPLQATAEEVVFRGMFMQSLGAWLGGSGLRRGSWLRGPWLPIAVPAIVFGFAHLYDVWGWGEVVTLALVAGWLTWRTGGLEAAISLHVLNNLIVTALLAVGVMGETGQTESSGGPLSLLATMVGLALYAWWVDRDFTRRDGVRTRIDLVAVERPAAPFTAPPAGPSAAPEGASPTVPPASPPASPPPGGAAL